MKRAISTIIAIATLLPVFAGASGPTIIDTLPVTGHDYNTLTTQSFTYTPGAGNNRAVVLCGHNDVVGFVASLNGVSLRMKRISGGTQQLGGMFYGYITDSDGIGTGTFTVTSSSSAEALYYVVTIQDVVQSGPIDDAQSVGDALNATTNTVNLTTSVGNDILLACNIDSTKTMTVSSFGAGETRVMNDLTDTPANWLAAGSWKAAAAGSGSESMTVNTAAGNFIDQGGLAIKYLAAAVATAGDTTQSWFNMMHQ